MQTRLINFILLTFVLLPIASYAKLNAITSIETEQIAPLEQWVEIETNVFLYETPLFHLSDSQCPLLPQIPKSATSIIIQITGQQPTKITKWCWNVGQTDIYLLNPNGIHINRLQPESPIQNNIYLSTAHHFSYLTQQFIFHSLPKPIEIQDSFVQFEKDKTLALLGGDISYLNTTIALPDGEMTLISAASQGEIIKNESYSINFDKMGDINVKRHSSMLHKNQQADIELSGKHGGKAFVRSNNLKLDNGWIFADARACTNCSYLKGKGIDIEVTNNMTLKHAGRITADTLIDSTGHGGDINIIAKNQILLKGYSYEGYKYEKKMTGEDDGNFNFMFSTVATNINGTGNGGNINVSAKKFIMDNRTAIQTNLTKWSKGGNSGIVTIHASELFHLKNYSQINMFSVEGSHGNIGKLNIFTENLKLQDSIIRLQAKGCGKGGDVFIKSNNIEILNTDKNLAWIKETCQAEDLNNTTLENTNSSKPQGSILGFVKGQAKEASDVKIITKNLILSEGGYIDLSSRNHQDGGELYIKADNIQLKGQTCPSKILSAALAQGNGGLIKLNIKDSLAVLNKSAIIANSYIPPTSEQPIKSKTTCPINQPSNIQTNLPKKGGNIDITSKRLLIDNQSFLSVASKDQKQAGNITLNTENIELKQQSHIVARSEYKAGGNIQILDNRQLYLTDQSYISTSSKSYSEQYGGGDITIKNTDSIALNQGDIVAKGVKGKGGNIEIKTGTLIRSKQSEISADSELGIDGKQAIEQANTHFLQTLFSKLSTFEQQYPISLRNCANAQENQLILFNNELFSSHPFFPYSATHHEYHETEHKTVNVDFLYEQSVDARFMVVDIQLQGKTIFTPQLNAVLQQIRPDYQLPNKLSFKELIDIQTQLREIYKKYYFTEFEKANGDTYNTQTINIPNQDISDGIIYIDVFEEQLEAIEFIEAKQPLNPTYVRSRFAFSQPLRLIDLKQSLSKLVNSLAIEKFYADLQIGSEPHQKILYLNLTPAKASETPDIYNQLGWNDYSFKQLVNDGKTLYQSMPLNRMDTVLEQLHKERKYQDDLTVIADHSLDKIGLEQPIYEQRYPKQRLTAQDKPQRAQEKLSFILQFGKQAVKTYIKQKTLNTFADMWRGKKRDYAYYVGQKWTKVYENQASDYIHSIFQTTLHAKRQPVIWHYQKYKYWTLNKNAYWKLNIQLADNNMSFLDRFLLSDENAIHAYPEYLFVGQNGLSSRLSVALTKSTALFFDMGIVWDTTLPELSLTTWLKQQQNHRWSQANTEDYVNKLKQPLWKQAATIRLSDMLQQQWQQHWQPCWDKLMPAIRENRVAEFNQNGQLQCNLHLIGSVGIDIRLPYLEKIKAYLVRKL